MSLHDLSDIENKYLVSSLEPVFGTSDSEIPEVTVYKTIETYFRRKFPFGYPGTNGQRYFRHSWKVRQGDTNFAYHICRYCFDIRVKTTKLTVNTIVQTGLCPSCRVDALVSRHYWDNIYTALCTCPVLGLRFPRCIKWKLARVGYHNCMLKVGHIQQRDTIQAEIRNNTSTERKTSETRIGSESDSVESI